MTDQPLKLGSSVIPLYVERQMKVYAVTEGEFNSLSTQNTEMTIYVTVGFAILKCSHKHLGELTILHGCAAKCVRSKDICCSCWHRAVIGMLYFGLVYSSST